MRQRPLRQRPLRPLALALAFGGLAALAGTAAAQGGIQFETESELKYFAAVNSYDLTSIGIPGAQGRTVYGDPTGDLTGAMFFTVDDEVHWSRMPYALTAAAPLATPAKLVTDMVIVRHSTGKRDVLVLSDSDGLSVATYEDATNDFSVSVLADSAAWVGATQLTSHAFVGNTKTMISGLLADGLTVRVSEVDELGENHLFSITVPAPFQTFDHDVIDYDGDGVLEVAFVNSWGLFVFNRQGGLLRREQISIDTGGVAAFDSLDGRRLAFWFVESATGAAHLRVVDGVVTQTNLPLIVNPPGNPLATGVIPHQMVAGDYNADGNEDLLLMLHHQFCILMINQADDTATPPDEHFSATAGDYDALPLSGNPSSAMAPGASLAFFGNIDSDPGDDVICPVDPLNRIEIHTREGELDPGNSNIQFVGLKFEDLVTPNSTYEWDETALVGKLNLALDIPAENLPGGPQPYDHVQVLSWFQNGSNQELTLLGEQNNVHLIDDQGGSYQWCEVIAQSNHEPLPGSYWPTADNMWVVLRLVRVDGQENIVGAGRFTIGAFTLRTSAGGQSIPPYLSGLPGAGPEVELHDADKPTPSGSQPTQSSGGAGSRWSNGNAAGGLSLSGVHGPGILKGEGYVGAYVPQASSVLFPPGDQPLFPGLSLLGQMGLY